MALKSAGRPARGRIWRTAWRTTKWFVVVSLLSLVLAAVVAAALLLTTGSARGASQAWSALRPWLLAAQVVGLGLAWHGWPRLVAWLDRRWPMTPEAQQAFIAWRPRLFLMLGAMEAFNLARVLAA